MRMWADDSKTKANGKGRAIPVTSQMKVEAGIQWMLDYHKMTVTTVKISRNEPDKAIVVPGVAIVEEDWIQPGHFGFCDKGDTDGLTTKNPA